MVLCSGRLLFAIFGGTDIAHVRIGPLEKYYKGSFHKNSSIAYRNNGLRLLILDVSLLY